MYKYGQNIIVNMPQMNISLTEKEKIKLKKLSEKENRSYNKQIVHMMEYYIRKKEEEKK